MVLKETLCIQNTTTSMEQDGGFEFATHKITSCYAARKVEIESFMSLYVRWKKDFYYYPKTGMVWSLGGL